MKVRKSVFAGSWYPGTASECEAEIKGFLDQANGEPPSSRSVMGGIVPHAGWYFSGSVACNVIHRMAEQMQPDVFVVFGMHLHTRSPRYIMTDGAWETPFGAIPIEGNLGRAIVGEYAFEIETADHFSPDNTIELQLPFIKFFFPHTSLVPIGVPPEPNSLEIGKAVATASNRLGLKVKILGSTDLTHYGYSYGFSPKGTGREAVEWVKNDNDRSAIDAMIDMDPERVIREALENQNACCAGAAATAIASVKHLGASQAETVAYTTSYDRSPGESFVGYVGVVFS